MKIRIVGVGGGGCKLLQAFYRHNERLTLDVSYYAIDTNIQSLDECSRLARHEQKNLIPTLCLGEKSFRGFNSGGDVEQVREIANESSATFNQVCQESDIIVILTTLGGGVGNGLSSALAKAAVSQGAYIVVIALLPFEFEGLSRSTQATQVIKQLNVIADLVLTIPNNLLFQVLPSNATVKEAFDQSNRWVCSLLEFLLNPLLSRSVDFNTFLKHFSDKPDIVFFAWGESSASCANALDELQLSPFWKTLENSTAIKSLLIHTFAEQDIPLQELKNIPNQLQKTFENTSLNILTVHHNAPTYFGKTAIFVLATGHSYNLTSYRHRSKNFPPPLKNTKEQTIFAFNAKEDDDYFDTPTYLRKGIRID